LLRYEEGEDARRVAARHDSEGSASTVEKLK
jgi:hypothetical protein